MLLVLSSVACRVLLEMRHGTGTSELLVMSPVALRTHLMFADALTKSLPGPAHIQHAISTVSLSRVINGNNNNIAASCLALRRLGLKVLSPPVCYMLNLLLLLSLLSLLFCVLSNSCGFTPMLGEGNYL